MRAGPIARATPLMFEQTLNQRERQREAISRIQAINECTLSYNSALWRDPATFGLRTTADDPCRDWRTDDGTP